MDENKALVKHVNLGALEASGPADIIEQATYIARTLKSIVDDRKLYTMIQGRQHVRVEGWTTMGAMLGILPREDEVKRLEDGSYEATVSLIRSSDGMVVGRGSALCGVDERRWGNAEEYARRSMAITRATSKAYRLGFSWIIALAGYEVTPAEEMDFVTGEIVETPRPPRPSAREKLLNRYATLSSEAVALGIGADPIPDGATDADIIEAGKLLAARIEAHKAAAEEPEPVIDMDEVEEVEYPDEAHWIDDDKNRRQWWAWTTDQGLSNAEVYEALGVAKMHDYTGAMGDAKAAVAEWVKTKV